ncbi:hypothetical protein THOE12_90201 [Vibrio rotiferianus]|nr:hypothetical protein THOE12_90201 [Vibrio rotiferianus]
MRIVVTDGYSKFRPYANQGRMRSFAKSCDTNRTKDSQQTDNLQIFILLKIKLLYFNKEINDFLGIKQCKISGCRQNSTMSATTLGVLYSNMLSAWRKKGIKS